MKKFASEKMSDHVSCRSHLIRLLQIRLKQEYEYRSAYRVMRKWLLPTKSKESPGRKGVTTSPVSQNIMMNRIAYAQVW